MWLNLFVADIRLKKLDLFIFKSLFLKIYWSLLIFAIRRSHRDTYQSFLHAYESILSVCIFSAKSRINLKTDIFSIKIIFKKLCKFVIHEFVSATQLPLLLRLLQIAIPSSTYLHRKDSLSNQLLATLHNRLASYDWRFS